MTDNPVQALPSPSRTPEQLARLEAFLRALLEENKRQNLTAITDPEEAMTRHIEDALALPSLFPLSGKTVIDVGTGGGLPGLPLRLLDDSIRLTLLDATEKKVEFLRRVCLSLDLPDVTCLSGRAEELGLTKARERFDVALARGVAFLPMLCELCLPLVRVGGYLLAMKKADCDEESQAAANAMRVLGGRLETIKRYILPGGQSHALVIIKKVKKTPEDYPRRFGKIKASPL